MPAARTQWALRLETLPNDDRTTCSAEEIQAIGRERFLTLPRLISINFLEPPPKKD